MSVPADHGADHNGDDASGPVIRDKRRIDPVTGQLRETAPAGTGKGDAVADPGPVGAVASGDDAPGGDDVAALTAQVAERTADLQRVSAEFANYKKRVERDRQAVAEQALASILLGLLPVLDDIDRARDHGELEGGVKSITDNLETTLGKLGLVRFGEAGEPFDPKVHEALTHGLSADVSEQTCSEVFQPGYRIGERVLRPARVAVVDPAPGDPDETARPDQDDRDTAQG